MLKIRLSRTGRKNYPSYRIVVTNSRHKRNGKFLEIIGHYNLQTEPPVLTLNKERLNYWLDKGAQASEGLKKLLREENIP